MKKQSLYFVNLKLESLTLSSTIEMDLENFVFLNSTILNE